MISKPIAAFGRNELFLLGRGLIHSAQVVASGLLALNALQTSVKLNHAAAHADPKTIMLSTASYTNLH